MVLMVLVLMLLSCSVDDTIGALCSDGGGGGDGGHGGGRAMHSLIRASLPGPRAWHTTLYGLQPSTCITHHTYIPRHTWIPLAPHSRLPPHTCMPTHTCILPQNCKDLPCMCFV